MDDKKNIFWQLIQFVFSLVIALIILKINIVHYGAKLFGIWIMLAAIWGFGSALDFGFGISIIKYVAHYKKSDKKKLSKFLSSSFFVFTLIGIIIFFLLIAVSYLLYFNNSKLIDSSIIGTAKSITLILGIAFYFQFLNIFFRSFFEGLSRFEISSKIIIFQNVLLLMSVVVTYLFNFSIIILAYAYLSSYFLTFLFSFFVFKQYFKDYRIHFKYFNLSEVIKIISFSFSVQTISILSAVIDPILKYLFGNFYSPSFIPFYEIARRFAISISQMFFAMFRTLLPRASVCKSKEEQKEFFDTRVSFVTRVGIVYSGLFYGILAIPLIIFIGVIFKSNIVIVIFLILALPETINNFGYASYIFILGLGKGYFLSLIHLINLVITIIAVAMIFYLFKNPLGLLGYFVSVLIGNILILLFIRKNIVESLLKFYINIKVKKLILFIFLMLVNLILAFNYQSMVYLSTFCFSVISFFIFLNDLRFYYRELIKYLKEKRNYILIK